jgi:hypothetical protein
MFYFGLRFLVLAGVVKADRTALPSAIVGFKFAALKRPAGSGAGADRDLVKFKDLNRITYAFVCAGLSHPEGIVDCSLLAARPGGAARSTARNPGPSFALQHPRGRPRLFGNVKPTDW